MPYPSSLTDKKWEIIEPLFPQKWKTRPSNWTKREILNGVLYQLKNGCNWIDLPKDFPPYSTVFWHYKPWRNGGLIKEILEELHGMVLVQAKKKRIWTALIMVDSQATKNTCNANKESKGFCVYKCTNGIKRHLAVESLGFPFFTHCTKASVTDDQGLIEMFTENIDYFKAKPMNIPKITILVDDGYHPNKIIEELKKIYPKIMSKIKFEQSPKLTKEEKVAAGKSGFVPVKMRCGQMLGLRDVKS
jgi:transposase